MLLETNRARSIYCNNVKKVMKRGEPFLFDLGDFLTLCFRFVYAAWNLILSIHCKYLDVTFLSALFTLRKMKPEINLPRVNSGKFSLGKSIFPLTKVCNVTSTNVWDHSNNLCGTVILISEIRRPCKIHKAKWLDKDLNISFSLKKC